MDDKKILPVQYLAARNYVHLPSISSKKGSETTSTKSPAFQFIPHDELLSLYEQRKGSQYFIPEGFEPVLIPRGSPLQPVANLLQNGKNLQHQLLIQQKQQQLKFHSNAAAPDVVVVNNKKSIVSSINNNSNNNNNNTSSDVRFPQLVLARSSAPTPQRGSVAKTQKPKKPPRPPNAFILYRRSKQPDIVAQNEGISNNEVSKQVGEMWHKEPLEEKMKFQRLADAAKMEHMKKYPEYKYRPRRPHEKRRRTKRPSASLSNNNNANKTNDEDVSNTTSNANNDSDTSPLISNSIPSNDNELFLQPERRSSIESISTSDFFDESRRSSMISCGDINGDINEYEYDYTLFDDVPSLVTDEPSQLSSYASPCPSNEYNNVCVENTTSFDIMMDGVTPGNDSDVNPHQFSDYFDFYPDYMQFDNSFDYNSLSSLMSSPNDQIMSCEPLTTNIDA